MNGRVSSSLVRNSYGCLCWCLEPCWHRCSCSCKSQEPLRFAMAAVVSIRLESRHGLGWLRRRDAEGPSPP